MSIDDVPRWVADPDQEGPERYGDGPEWTDRDHPEDALDDSHLPEHVPELQRALAAATADIDSIEDRLSALFERSEGKPRPSDGRRAADPEIVDEAEGGQGGQGGSPDAGVVAGAYGAEIAEEPRTEDQPLDNSWTGVLDEEVSGEADADEVDEAFAELNAELKAEKGYRFKRRSRKRSGTAPPAAPGPAAVPDVVAEEGGEETGSAGAGVVAEEYFAAVAAEVVTDDRASDELATGLRDEEDEEVEEVDGEADAGEGDEAFAELDTVLEVAKPSRFRFLSRKRSGEASPADPGPAAVPDVEDEPEYGQAGSPEAGEDEFVTGRLDAAVDGEAEASAYEEDEEDDDAVVAEEHWTDDRAADEFVTGRLNAVVDGEAEASAYEEDEDEEDDDAVVAEEHWTDDRAADEFVTGRLNAVVDGEARVDEEDDEDEEDAAFAELDAELTSEGPSRFAGAVAGEDEDGVDVAVEARTDDRASDEWATGRLAAEADGEADVDDDDEAFAELDAELTSDELMSELSSRFAEVVAEPEGGRAAWPEPGVVAEEDEDGAVVAEESWRDDLESDEDESVTGFVNGPVDGEADGEADVDDDDEYEYDEYEVDEVDEYDEYEVDADDEDDESLEELHVELTSEEQPRFAAAAEPERWHTGSPGVGVVAETNGAAVAQEAGPYDQASDNFATGPLDEEAAGEVDDDDYDEAFAELDAELRAEKPSRFRFLPSKRS